MTEQELRELMQEKLKMSGLQENISKIVEMITEAYDRGFQDAMDIAAKMYKQYNHRNGASDLNFIGYE